MLHKDTINISTNHYILLVTHDKIPYSCEYPRSREVRAITLGDCCIKANRCVAFGIRLRSHTEVCSLQTSPSAPCASSFLQSLDNLARKVVRLLTFATVSSYTSCCPQSGRPPYEIVSVPSYTELLVTFATAPLMRHTSAVVAMSRSKPKMIQ